MQQATGADADELLEPLQGSLETGVAPRLTGSF